MTSTPARPVEPPPSRWTFGEIPDKAGDLIDVGRDLEPGTVLAAYRSGIFPMPVSKRVLGWFSPASRGVMPPGALRISRSLQKSCRRFTIHVDRDFGAVLDACANPRRPHGWITDDVKRAYRTLFDLGWVHSIEAWDDDGLAGGLYGVAIGGLFAGESMFHYRTDASKVALVALVDLMGKSGTRWLIDMQWLTPHLARLGGVAIPRSEYLGMLPELINAPMPPDLLAAR